MTTTVNTIGGVRVDAPLFMGASEADLRKIVKLLSDASFNYADDSTGEWNRALAEVNLAAAICNIRRLPFRAIECLHRDKQQLVTFEQFMDAILRDARGK